MDDESQTDDINTTDDSPEDAPSGYDDMSSFFDNAQDVEVEDAADEYEDARNAGDTTEDFDNWLGSMGMSREDLSEESQADLASRDTEEYADYRSRLAEYNAKEAEKQAKRDDIQMKIDSNKNMLDSRAFQTAWLTNNYLDEMKGKLEAGEISQKDFDRATKGMSYTEIPDYVVDFQAKSHSKDGSDAKNNAQFQQNQADVMKTDYKDQYKDAIESTRDYRTESNKDGVLGKIGSFANSAISSAKNSLNKAFGGGDDITGLTNSNVMADKNGDGKVGAWERVQNTTRNVLTNNDKNTVDLNGDGKIGILDGVLSGLWNVGQRAGNYAGQLLAPGSHLGDTVLGSLKGITTDEFGEKQSFKNALGEYAKNAGRSLAGDIGGMASDAFLSQSPILSRIDGRGIAESAFDKGVQALGDYFKGAPGRAAGEALFDMFSESDNSDNPVEENMRKAETSISPKAAEQLASSMSQTKYDTKKQQWMEKHGGDPATVSAVSDEQLKRYIVAGFTGQDKMAEVLRRGMMLELFGGKAPSVWPIR